MKTQLYEILVPCTMHPEHKGLVCYTAEPKPVHTRHHKVWDKYVLGQTGGLTIMKPTKGYWIADNGQNFVERMIPVRIACLHSQMLDIAQFTKKHYRQQKVMFYVISEDCHII